MPASSTARRVWLWVERTAWIAGLAALGVWAGSSLAGTIGARHEIQRFTALQSAIVEAAAPAAAPAPDIEPWSGERVRAWRATYDRPGPPPLAVLRIPRIGLEVAVLEGTTDWALNRGVGHIEGTPAPGSDGNAGIAGHRDGFFRGLKDIRPGDRLELETLDGVQGYRIERTWIVKPEDVWVLDSTNTPAITLVTCYPFYFIGSAPQRFIVRAVRIETAAKRSVS
jgi:sortase A